MPSDVFFKLLLAYGLVLLCMVLQQLLLVSLLVRLLFLLLLLIHDKHRLTALVLPVELLESVVLLLPALLVSLKFLHSPLIALLNLLLALHNSLLGIGVLVF